MDAKKYAEFCIICFLPHPSFFGENTTLTPAELNNYVSWDTLGSRVQLMTASDKLIDRLRLDTMFTHMAGFQSNHQKDILLTNYCHRDSTKWSDAEKKEAANLWANHHTKHRAGNDTVDDSDLLLPGN